MRAQKEFFQSVLTLELTKAGEFTAPYTSPIKLLIGKEMFHIADGDLKITFILPYSFDFSSYINFFNLYSYCVFYKVKALTFGTVNKVECSGLQRKKERIKLKKQFMEHFFPKGNVEIPVLTNKCLG